MADSILPIPLNLGLDLVTPPLMIEPGSLIACMNYEMTDMAGYRRIDGYEQYDGFPNGDLNEFYIIGLSPITTGTITVGSIVYRTTSEGLKIPIGVVVGDNLDGTYAVAAYRTPLDFVFEPQFLSLSDSLSILLLSNGSDALLINGDAVVFTGDFSVIAAGVAFSIDVTSNPVSGSSLASDAQVYLDALRSYSSVLRAGVGAAPGPIAGLYWFEDRLLAAINAVRLRGTGAPVEGTRILWNGGYYRVLTSTDVGSGEFFIYLAPLGLTPSATVNNTIQGVDLAGVSTFSFGTANPASAAEASASGSAYAYLGYFNNPNTSTERGFTFMTPSPTLTYNLGTLTGTLPPALSLANDTYYYVVGVGPTVLKVKLTSVTVESGSFNTSNAVGAAQVEVVEVVSGIRDHVIVGDELHSEYPTTASSKLMSITGEGVSALLAGTGSLDLKNSRYVWNSYNFYGQSSALTAYSTTGASRSFWANKEAYGNITAIPDVTKDIPKYLSFHANKLALGFQKGSVLLSVVGEPYNFSGLDGAIEIATGDDITGLLEATDGVLAVFGRTSIRKITGTTDVDTQLGTISGNSGAFDYTVVLVGTNPVFASLNGISTLEQTAAYGDFLGTKLTAKVSAWLRPKLASSYQGFEQGGAACAFPVRSKNQYRLVLRTGEVVVVTFTEKGPTIMFSNWTTAGQLPRIPYAWSSEVSVDNKEKLHIRWEGTNLEKQCFQLDSGWGFNGLTFNHYFDTAHVFNQQGAMFMGIEKVRMYGQGHGAASLNLKSSSIEEDFNQPYHTAIQDISMPRNVEILTGQMRPVTGIIDQANWGLGVKLRVQGNYGENSSLTEPSHICQVFVLHTRTEGATDR